MDDYGITELHYASNPKYFEGDPYLLAPGSYEFDDEYTTVNPLYDGSTREGVAENIATEGQQKPIFMLKGKCVDGRHRSEILEELGRYVWAIDIRTDLSEDVVYMKCNEDTIGGRNMTPTQRAITAYLVTARSKVSMVAAAKMYQVNRRSLGYAKYLYTHGFKEELTILHKGGSVRLLNMETATRSLEYLCKMGKDLYEKDKLVVDDSERIHSNPDSYIKTNEGKRWYYGVIGSRDLDVDIKMLLAELANLKYKLKE